MRRNIVLIGMPGVGKSTLGVVLAKVVNLGFVDVDLVIQQRNGATLQQLIDDLGTERFIELESEALRSLVAEGCVIATGGSAVYSHEAIGRLRENGTVVYLEASYESIASRLGDLHERGVVMRGEANGLRALFDERRPLYEEAADIIVNVEGLTIADAARKVAAAVGAVDHRC